MKKFVFILIVLLALGGYFWYHNSQQSLDTLGQNIGNTMSGANLQALLSGVENSGSTLVMTAKQKLLNAIHSIKNSVSTPPTPEDAIACTMDYTPVCGEVAVQCIKAPCPAVKQTFGNRCTLDANKLAHFLYNGECASEDLSSCTSYFDGCNTCSVKDGKVAGCTKKYCQTPEAPRCLESTTQIANPASVNCKEQGGTLEIQTAKDGSQLGMCTFPAGNQCEEWALYRGECSK